jgi:hypothetical protein
MGGSRMTGLEPMRLLVENGGNSIEGSSQCPS